MAIKGVEALLAAAIWCGGGTLVRAGDEWTARPSRPAQSTTILRSSGTAPTSSRTTTTSSGSHSEGKSELKWRPRTQATPVGLGTSKSINRTQMLERIDATGGQSEKRTLPSLDTEELPALDRQLKGISQPGTAPQGGAQPEDDDPMRRRSPDFGKPLTPNRAPSLDPKTLAQGPMTGASQDCPSPSSLRKISEISMSLDPPEQGELPKFCGLGDSSFEGRCWSPITYTWKASSLCHKPLYFEEPDLERYGHTWKHWTPLVSAVHFFGTFPLLPYKMGIEAPWECMYALGYYEPGSCAPYIIPPVPLNIRGGLLEAGAWTTGVILIP